MNFVLFLVLLSYFNVSLHSKTVRIIGGDSAVVGQFPFAAALYVRKNDGNYFCGGTLINNEFVLTSAHCIDNAISVTIQLGSNTLQGNDVNRITVSTSEFFINPDFDSETLKNDIGLIKLRMPIDFTDYVRNVHFLPTFRLQDSAPTIAIGWGQINDDDSSLANDLQSVNLTTISSDECKLTYGNQITDDMVCVSGNYNEGSCTGDMGSPLLQHVGRGYYLNVGVASFISGNGCESTDPSGYTRTFSYMEWIKNVTSI